MLEDVEVNVVIVNCLQEFESSVGLFTEEGSKLQWDLEEY